MAVEAQCGQAIGTNPRVFGAKVALRHISATLGPSIGKVMGHTAGCKRTGACRTLTKFAVCADVSGKRIIFFAKIDPIIASPNIQTLVAATSVHLPRLVGNVVLCCVILDPTQHENTTCRDEFATQATNTTTSGIAMMPCLLVQLCCSCFMIYIFI